MNDEKKELLLWISALAIIVIAGSFAIIADKMQPPQDKAPTEYLSINTTCARTCEAVATRTVNDTNYTEPHRAGLFGNDYCLCVFQGTGRVFAFDATLKRAYDLDKECAGNISAACEQITNLTGNTE